MNKQDGNIRQSLQENETNTEINRKQKSPTFWHKFFGCCLERNIVKNKQNKDEEEDDSQGDISMQQSVFHSSKYKKGTNHQNMNSQFVVTSNKNGVGQVYQMSFNEQQNEYQRKNNQVIKNQNNTYKNQQIINQNGKGNDKMMSVQNESNLNQAINSAINQDFGNYKLNANINQNKVDLRSSSYFPQTHNYDFDISNYNTNQVFLLGNILQLMIYIKDQKYSINYSNYELPDDFAKTQTVQQNTNSYNINNALSHPQSYNFRESLQFQGNNFRNSKLFPGYEFDPSTIKFYRRRNQGIFMDSKSWPHLIPESVVQYIARRASQSNRIDSLIDASCGVGQFSIAFANHINSIISIETDPQRYNMARNNAQVYGVQNSKYNQNERISFNEGILFYNDSSFIDEQFAVNANLSDCVFFAPHLLAQNINNLSQEQQQSYFNTDQFYQDLKKYLRKAFKIAPQVILLTPRNVKTIEIVDSFTEAIKENLKQTFQIKIYQTELLIFDIFCVITSQKQLIYLQINSKVKKCSLEVEKIFINDHLKYICFYFGEFGNISYSPYQFNYFLYFTQKELSYQEEFKFIDQYLEKCNTQNKQKKNQLNNLDTNQDIKQQIRIHQQIFTELGKFQLLNIVHKFAFHFKLENLKISEDQTLLSLFYAYLINYKFMSQSRISQIISKKLIRSSAVSPNIHNQNISQDDQKQKDQKQFMIDNNFKRVESIMVQKLKTLKTNKNTDINASPQRTFTQNQYITEDDNNGLNNFDQNGSINQEYDLKQDEKYQKCIKLQYNNDSNQDQQNIETNLRQTDRTLSNFSHNDQDLNKAQEKFQQIKPIYKTKDEYSAQKRKSTRTMTQQSIQQSKDQINKVTQSIAFDIDEQNNKKINDISNSKKLELNKKFKSETETESECEYEEYSSVSKSNINSSQTNNIPMNQASFLRKTQRIYDSKIDDQNYKNKEMNEYKKSQICDSFDQTQELYQNQYEEEDVDELIVLNFDFFEQNKKDIFENDNQRNTSYNLMNTSRLIAHEINNEINNEI